MLRTSVCRLTALATLCVSAFAADNRVPAEFLYDRVWAIVPLIGKGTADDPKRPMFVPASPLKTPQGQVTARAASTSSVPAPVAPQPVLTSAPPPVISYSMQLSDDRKSAIVEFVGPNPAALKFIVESKDPGVTAFEQGKATTEQIETAFKKVKKTFALDTFPGSAR